MIKLICIANGTLYVHYTDVFVCVGELKIGNSRLLSQTVGQASRAERKCFCSSLNSLIFQVVPRYMRSSSPCELLLFGTVFRDSSCCNFRVSRSSNSTLSQRQLRFFSIKCAFPDNYSAKPRLIRIVRSFDSKHVYSTISIVLFTVGISFYICPELASPLRLY